MPTLLSDIEQHSESNLSPNHLSLPTSALRIVHFVSSLKVGGMEHFVLRLAAAQKEHGHEVSVFALQGGPLADETERLGLPTNILPGQNKAARALNAALLLRRLRPDIAHAHNQTSLHYAVLAKRLAAAQVVMTNHGQGQGSPRTPSVKEWRHTDAIVAVSQAVAERMETPSVQDKIRVILNGITPTPPVRSREAVRSELRLSDKTVGIIVARIDGLKGHECLIRALAQLPKDAAGTLTMLIAGDGGQRENMAHLAGSLGLSDQQIRFLGFRSDVSDLLAAADFFVLPSLTEGLPLSVLEAMSQRLPIIATPVGGIPELVDDGTHGLLVPVNDSVALASAITTLSCDRCLRNRYGEAGHQRVISEFSFEAMTDQYEALYADLCPNPRGRH